MKRASHPTGTIVADHPTAVGGGVAPGAPDARRFARAAVPGPPPAVDDDRHVRHAATGTGGTSATGVLVPAAAILPAAAGDETRKGCG